MQKISFFIAMLALGSTLVSCRKSDTSISEIVNFDPYHSNTEIQQAYTTMQEVVSDAIEQAASTYLGNGITIGQCPQISMTPVSANDAYPATLTLAFGSGCTWRGHQMSGLVSFTVNKEPGTTGAVLTGSAEALSIDGSSLSGTMKIYTQGGYANLNFECTNVQVTTDDGKTATLATLTAQRKQVGGAATSGPDDDSFEITMEGSGTGTDGKPFTLSTTSALLRTYSCRWISQGEVEVKSGLKTAVADFGDGTCDDAVLITVGEQTKTINLP